MRTDLKPNIKEWRHEVDPLWDQEVDISDEVKAAVVKRHTKFFDWTVSYTKKIVQVSFTLFVFVNIYILGMISLVYWREGSVLYLDLLLNRVYDMFINVIGGYIIKSATENSIKIAFSVLSQYLETRYNKKSKVDKLIYEESETGEELSEEEEIGDADVVLLATPQNDDEDPQRPN